VRETCRGKEEGKGGGLKLEAWTEPCLVGASLAKKRRRARTGKLGFKKSEGKVEGGGETKGDAEKKGVKLFVVRECYKGRREKGGKNENLEKEAIYFSKKTRYIRHKAK